MKNVANFQVTMQASMIGDRTAGDVIDEKDPVVVVMPDDADSEVSLHYSNLKYFCRACGLARAIRTDRSSKQAARYHSEILRVWKCDILQDNPYIHPPYLCEACYLKIIRWRKWSAQPTESPPNIPDIHIFRAHIPGQCHICEFGKQRPVIKPAPRGPILKRPHSPSSLLENGVKHVVAAVDGEDRSSVHSALSRDHPCIVIPDVMEEFHRSGWVPAGGGGMCVKYGDRIYTTPAGKLRDRLKPCDILVKDVADLQDDSKSTTRMNHDTCTLGMTSLLRANDAGCVLHTHSQASTLLSMLCTTDAVRISHQQMICSIRKRGNAVTHRFDETLTIPIVETISSTGEWQQHLSDCLQQHLNTYAILVRRHGAFVWGSNWQDAKMMCEAYEFLFDLSCKMIQHGVVLCPESSPS